MLASRTSSHRQKLAYSISCMRHKLYCRCLVKTSPIPFAAKTSKFWKARTLAVGVNFLARRWLLGVKFVKFAITFQVSTFLLITISTSLIRPAPSMNSSQTISFACEPRDHIANEIPHHHLHLIFLPACRRAKINSPTASPITTAKNHAYDSLLPLHQHYNRPQGNSPLRNS